jgi:CBS domain-containing protein
MTNKTVADVMTADPTTVEPQTPLQEAIKIMAEKHISGLPVVDRTGKLVGVISETDLMWKETGVEPPPYIMILDSVIYLQNPARYEKEIHKVLGQTVGEAMTDKPISIEPDRPLREAAHLMHEKNIRRLPVLDPQNERVIGIITRGDIIRAMANF